MSMALLPKTKLKNQMPLLLQKQLTRKELAPPMPPKEYNNGGLVGTVFGTFCMAFFMLKNKHSDRGDNNEGAVDERIGCPDDSSCLELDPQNPRAARPTSGASTTTELNSSDAKPVEDRGTHGETVENIGPNPSKESLVLTLSVDNTPQPTESNAKSNQEAQKVAASPTDPKIGLELEAQQQPRATLQSETCTDPAEVPASAPIVDDVGDTLLLPSESSLEPAGRRNSVMPGAVDVYPQQRETFTTRPHETQKIPIFNIHKEVGLLLKPQERPAARLQSGSFPSLAGAAATKCERGGHRRKFVKIPQKIGQPAERGISLMPRPVEVRSSRRGYYVRPVRQEAQTVRPFTVFPEDGSGPGRQCAAYVMASDTMSPLQHAVQMQKKPQRLEDDVTWMAAMGNSTSRIRTSNPGVYATNMARGPCPPRWESKFSGEKWTQSMDIHLHPFVPIPGSASRNPVLTDRHAAVRCDRMHVVGKTGHPLPKMPKYQIIVPMYRGSVGGTDKVEFNPQNYLLPHGGASESYVRGVNSERMRLPASRFTQSAVRPQ